MSGVALAPPRDNRTPALIAAAGLHALVFLAVLINPQKAPMPIGSSVPINIVSSAPFTDTRQAFQAPQTQTAATPEPKPEQKPAPVAPVEAPPAFTKAAPQPVKTPTPPTPQPAQHARSQAAPAFNFNQMQQIIDNARRNSGAKASGAQRGPARAETAAQARPDAGQGVSQSDLVGLQQLLERLWNPNCDVAGGASVKLRVKFLIDLNGRVLGSPDVGGLDRSGDPVVAAAAIRAVGAVRRAAPYSEPYYGQSIVVNFDAKEACAKR
ncbi:MAG TPA: energy transducer TonB [Caulobacteraceae bacterium]|jgi:outer membrane biosynthesis protein TonB|nr:energy transducer TonB [Caulobacteraceae bacterium]